MVHVCRVEIIVDGKTCPVLRVAQIQISTCRPPLAAPWSAVLQEPHVSQPDSDDSVDTKKNRLLK